MTENLNFGGNSGEALRQYVARIETMEAEKAETASCIRDAYAEAKANGFDVKVMRQLIKIRKVNAQDLEEQESLLDVYKHALGMLPLFEQAKEA